MIPKIINQTWKTLDVPKQWEKAVESCENKHKDYKHIIWSHEMMEKFVKKEYPDFYDIYMSYTHDIQRCDTFRYLVLYKYGGIYLDMDIFCKKKLDSLLGYDLVLAESKSKKNNSFYMVTPNHPFIKFCIDNLPLYVNSYYYFGKHLHVMNSTGPNFLKNMLNKYGTDNIKNIYILNSKEFNGDCNTCNENICNGGTYFKHIEGKSWHSLDSTFYNLILCNYKKVITALIVLLIIFYIFFKRNKVFKLKKYLKIICV